MKKVLSMLLCATMLVTLLAGCGTKTDNASESKDQKVTEKADNETADTSNGSYKIGMTVQDLSNQIWAGSCEALKKLIEADGGSFTYLDCASNASTQIEQVENFIASDVDAIVIQPAEANALEEVLGQAMKAGIKVYCWDEDIKNADICWLIDNYELGKMIGDEAAKWINEKFNGECEVAVLDYPQLEILLQRGNGIVDAIKEKAPKAKIVAQSSAINATEGMSKTETFLQANPDIKVIACIGGGGAVGANEAVKASGKLTDDFGIFAADATEEELAAMNKNEACRMSVLITGGADKIADEIFSWLKKLLAGEEVEKKIYRETIPVTKENLSQYYSE
ncbi:sugar ABC transporter substrate-binding protein [Anaerosacchariphilus polymeriproducens]|uniref:Sugar ABC transporter substrate-binding protein n=1 Tax=Anaerosacchariphilus polymeriproducens TaxID=1812858 RepID=A0A371ASX1_9FIRM|nr:sugar ABC transporter substrate-binding protein [Anaerosacchariphilus polymeriproducens]RDU22560.1 sugar ABC transporter substrate-binding protein [Anaerosacchariphilus polymeriproducens]